MTEKFFGQVETLSDPANDGFAVVPSDDTPLDEGVKYLFVGTGGDLVLKGVNGDTALTFKNIPSGAFIPFRAAYVLEATTCEDILALT